MTFREVVIGSNSRVWKASAADPRIAARFGLAIGHAQLGQFAFTPADRVWVFSYSRNPAENSQMFSILAAAGVREVVYVATASAIVSCCTDCYEYPRVKRLAELEARQRLAARVLTLGVVYNRLEELPAGLTMATSQASINEFLLDPQWLDGEHDRRLFVPVNEPFATRPEAWAHRIYGALIWRLRRWPCALRPLDLLLRLAGFRWYGYVYLSNLLWNSTQS